MAVFTLIFTLLSPLQLADSFYIYGDYFNAITEYKRALFLNDTNFHALYMIGLSYERRKRYDFAARYLGDYLFYQTSEDAKKHLAFNLINMGRYKDVTLLLKGDTTSVSKRLLAISYGLSGSELEADSLLSTMSINVPRYPSQWLLKYPSYVLPGFGLFLLGEYKKGFLSLLFTVSTGYLSYYLLSRKRYPEAIVVLNTLFFRFYTGNIENALKIRTQRKKDFYKGLLKGFP